MQTGILHKISVYGRGNGGNVSHVLYDRCKRDGYDGNDGSDNESRVAILECPKGRAFKVDGPSDPVSLRHAGKVHFAKRDCNQIRTNDADDDGNDLDHALAPNIAYHDQYDGYKCNDPVTGTAVQGRLGKRKTDGNDQGSRYNGREEFHDLLASKKLDQSREDQI